LGFGLPHVASHSALHVTSPHVAWPSRSASMHSLRPSEGHWPQVAPDGHANGTHLPLVLHTRPLQQLVVALHVSFSAAQHTLPLQTPAASHLSLHVAELPSADMRLESVFTTKCEYLYTQQPAGQISW
jgi:hypothetical protein